ncbi:MAG: hypothetical protein K6F39_05700 [Lachnospiraceae bacterium]|nr:hypothetical protein [Lachnospiraceae bacterium]
MIGVYKTKKLDGSTYFRASITYKNKHISLGSSSDENTAFEMYKTAADLLYSTVTIDDHTENSPLNFSMWVVLINFRDNGVYFKNPIYLKKRFFLYYLNKDTVLKFDTDDLFYYSQHRIQARGGHLFCENYGTQVSLGSRYGIRPFAVKSRDYRFINDDDTDFRYHNIEIINQYYGVEKDSRRIPPVYKARITVRSVYTLGIYETEEAAAIAVNKAIDMLSKTTLRKKSRVPNYIDTLPASKYADIYSSIELPERFMKLINDHLAE